MTMGNTSMNRSIVSTLLSYLLMLLLLQQQQQQQQLFSLCQVEALDINPIRWTKKTFNQKQRREEVVSTYFDGVNKQAREQIKNCFNPAGTKIRDVCGVSNTERTATPDELSDRCMEFLAAHPDTVVRFYYGPTCGRGRTNQWVYAHWYEEGTWSGTSRGIEPDGSPLDVEGQTRFFVNDDMKIEEMVVTRTFSKWEMKLQAKNSS